MNKVRKCLPGLALVLTMAMAGIVAAQNPVPANAGTKNDSCCCCGNSCDMTKQDAMKNHVAAADKGNCCCCGDSCDMKKKDAMKNHVTSSEKHDCCCCGESCNMKEMKDTKKS